MRDWDWAGAGQAHQRAIQLNPGHVGAHHAYSRYLTALGRVDEALTEAKRAVELDPLELIPNSNLAYAYYSRENSMKPSSRSASSWSWIQTTIGLPARCADTCS